MSIFSITPPHQALRAGALTKEANRMSRTNPALYDVRPARQGRTPSQTFEWKEKHTPGQERPSKQTCVAARATDSRFHHDKAPATLATADRRG